MDIVLALLILGAGVVLFASERLSVDLVALVLLAALLVTGLVTPEEGVSGFSNPATLTVAAMFVLSAGLQRTGAVTALGHVLSRIATGELPLLLAVMLLAGTVSAFINNTAAVAILLPAVVSSAASHDVSTSKLLIPLSFASQFGGVCTLVGTSTNLLVNAIAERSGVQGFRLFEPGRLGLVLFGVGTLFFLLVGRRLLPTRRAAELTETYGLGEYITELRVLSGSALVGQRVSETILYARHGITVLDVIRDGTRVVSWPLESIQVGDVLLVETNVHRLRDARGRLRVALEPEFRLRDETLAGGDAMLLEVLVAPKSGLHDRTLAEARFRGRFNAVVLAIQRRGETLRDELASVRLKTGDVMLLLARIRERERLHSSRDLIVLSYLEEPAARRRKAPRALLIVAGVVGLAAFEILPIMVSALLGGVAMVILGCLRIEEAYEAIEWRVLVLLAGVLPLGRALEKSGAARYLSEHLLGWAGQGGPVVALATLYLLAAVLTEFMSNAAAAAFLAPIAISTAASLGVSPRPFLVGIMFAASTSFATPVGYQTNTMVYNAGGYRFLDFTRVGLPLNLVFWLVSVWLIPRLWPF